MIYVLVIQKRAENQISKAYHWYENKREGLGNDFLLCVDAALMTIQKNPFLFQIKYKNVRCSIIPRFP